MFLPPNHHSFPSLDWQGPTKAPTAQNEVGIKTAWARGGRASGCGRVVVGCVSEGAEFMARIGMP